MKLEFIAQVDTLLSQVCDAETLATLCIKASVTILPL